jgi:hypothetical protein
LCACLGCLCWALPPKNLAQKKPTRKPPTLGMQVWGIFGTPLPLRGRRGTSQPGGEGLGHFWHTIAPPGARGHPIAPGGALLPHRPSQHPKKRMLRHTGIPHCPRGGLIAPPSFPASQKGDTRAFIAASHTGAMPLGCILGMHSGDACRANGNGVKSGNAHEGAPYCPAACPECWGNRAPFGAIRGGNRATPGCALVGQ